MLSVKLAPVAEFPGAIASDKFTWLAVVFVIWIDLLDGTLFTVPNETEDGFAVMVA